MNSIITVGITGGIGTGKSTICRILGIMGYPVFYSDKAAKEVLHQNPSVIAGLKKLFGSQAYIGTTFNNQYVADIVFKDPEKLDQINKLVHPAVRELFTSWSGQQNSRIVFNEAAILMESGSYKNFSKTILITSPMDLRIERLLKRDNSTIEQIKQRMKNQWSDEQKIPLADYVIINDEKLLVVPQILEILKKLQS